MQQDWYQILKDANLVKTGKAFSMEWLGHAHNYWHERRLRISLTALMRLQRKLYGAGRADIAAQVQADIEAAING